MPDTESLRTLDSALERFLGALLPQPSGPALVVGLSGGPDSTALLLGLARCATHRSGLRLLAAHLDHALDPASSGRADRAAAIARELGVESVVARRAVAERASPGESVEAAARRVRYGFLEEVRLAHGARWIATAHHKDDQAETVLLRILYGSGPEGLAAMRPVRGRVVRPLLGLRRSQLAAAVRDAGLEPVDDPANRDPSLARVRVRRDLLPRLAREGSGRGARAGADALDRLVERLAGVADAAAGARRRLEKLLEPLLDPEPLSGGSAGRQAGVAVSAAALRSLPPPLLPHALALLHRRAGAPYPAGAGARAELARQLAAGGRGGCDCGGGWRWRLGSGRIELRPPAGRGGEEAGPNRPVEAFSYTLKVPGEVDIPELGLRLRVERRAVAPWMFEGAGEGAALALPIERGDRLVVRNRRPGDRLRPLGAPGTRKLKDLLIDRKIPRDRRDRLPLLCLAQDDERIAWVPGVTVDEAYRVPPGAERTWIAEVTP